MPDGYSLGPPGASASVEYKGDIVRIGRRCRLTSGSVRDADKSIGVHLNRVHRNPALGGLARFCTSIRRAEENARGRVFQEETELVRSIAGIQGRGCTCDRSRQKTHDGG